MISIGWIAQAVIGSFWGRMMAIAVASLAALGVNNWYQRSLGAKKERVKIVEKAKSDGSERNAKADKIRRNIKPSSAWKRLLSDYAGAGEQ